MNIAVKDKQGLAQSEHWIDGAPVKPLGGKYYEDRNPLDDSVYSRAADGSAEDIDRAVQVAHRAFDTYRKTLPRDRELWLIRAADLLERDKQEIVDILVDEVGSPLGKAMFEIDMSVRMFRAAAGIPRRLTGQTIPSDRPGCFSMSVREPVGVVASITPFNVPLVKAAKQVSVALACGNTVVALPSEEAPQIGFKLARLLHEAGFPAGSYNMVTGFGAKIGDSLTSHPLVKTVCFCGSTRVGRHIAELCARDFKKFTLELGGKSPMVIMADADIDAAVEAASFAIFFFQGQACMAPSRMIVERPAAEAFLAKFAAKAKSMQMGDLRDIKTALGPIISERQRNRIRTHIEDASAKGAKVVTGGKWQGNKCEPTILTDVRPEMTVFAEETFGPVASIYVVDSLEEALKLANDTEYGLAASVFTKNIDKALQLAQGIHCGMVHINAPSLQDEPHVPFGGMGKSGFGREGTETDVEAMTEWKWITVQLPTVAKQH